MKHAPEAEPTEDTIQGPSGACAITPRLPESILSGVATAAAGPMKGTNQLVSILARKYGISYETYLEMYRGQEGRCAICVEPFPKTPHLDHDHETGRVRALLCHRCNAGLGGFRDRPELLRGAAAYIEYHNVLRQWYGNDN